MLRAIKRYIRLVYREMKSTKKRNELLYYSDPDAQGLIMYVLVRRDILPLVHCGVQAAHAAVEFISTYKNKNIDKWATRDKTMILLSATGEDIQRCTQQFSGLGLKYAEFTEPDMSDTVTAVAFEPIMSDSDVRFLFHSLKLLS
jgi:peptidyl-tRNA hydrolase